MSTKLSLKSVSLQHVETVDFRKNERTCWREFLNKNRNFKLREGCALLLISKSLNQLCFVYGTRTIDSGVPVDVIASLKLRVSGGAWSPLRLSEYANAVGLELIGIKSFGEHYERRLRERASRRP